MVAPVIHRDDCGLECARPMARLRGRTRGSNGGPGPQAAAPRSMSPPNQAAYGALT
jgi:hypothetical protein